MKTKHRQSIFVVVRRIYTHPTVVDAVLDSFFSLETAEDRAAQYTQEFKEKHIAGYLFNVVTSTFYDL